MSHTRIRLPSVPEWQRHSAIHRIWQKTNSRCRVTSRAQNPAAAVDLLVRNFKSKIKRDNKPILLFGVPFRNSLEYLNNTSVKQNGGQMGCDWVASGGVFDVRNLKIEIKRGNEPILFLWIPFRKYQERPNGLWVRCAWSELPCQKFQG